MTTSKTNTMTTSKTNTMTPLNFSDVPRDWALCFQDDCPLAATCLRRRVGALAPADLATRNCVLPGARSGKPSCTLFVEDKPVLLARGMTRLLPRLSYEEGILMRRGLYAIFGSSSQYYRYRSGRWVISPRQQARVAALFRRCGFKSAPVFDSVAEGYYFGRH